MREQASQRRQLLEWMDEYAASGAIECSEPATLRSQWDQEQQERVSSLDRMREPATLHRQWLEWMDEYAASGASCGAYTNFVPRMYVCMAKYA